MALGKGWPSSRAGLGRQLRMLGSGCSGTAELGHSGERLGHQWPGPAVPECPAVLGAGLEASRG